MPDIDTTRYRRNNSNRKRPSSGGNGTRSSSGGGGSFLGNLTPSGLANTARRASVQGGAQNSAYLQQLQDMLFGGQQDQGGGGRRYVGGGGGGGGYDPMAFEKWRQAQLEKQKKELEGALMGAKNAALPLISKYSHDYGVNVGKIYKQNQAQTGQITGQLKGIGNQMTQGAMGQLASLRRDLGSQGAGGADMAALQGAAQQNIGGQQFLTNNADSYNRRLAQVMSGSAADAKSMGAAIGTSGKSNLENSYLQALMQIKMLGLT